MSQVPLRRSLQGHAHPGGRRGEGKAHFRVALRGGMHRAALQKRECFRHPIIITRERQQENSAKISAKTLTARTTGPLRLGGEGLRGYFRPGSPRWAPAFGCERPGGYGSELADDAPVYQYGTNGETVRKR